MKPDTDACVYMIFFFFLTKIQRYSFIQIDRIHQINVGKNVKGESANKLTSPKLIACNNKVSTNNMIKSKSPEYSCFGSVALTSKSLIESVISWSLYFNITKRTLQIKQCRTRRQTIKRHTQTTKSRKYTKENTWYMWTHLFWLKERGKKMHRGDSRSKNDLKPLLFNEWKRKKT